MSKTFYSESLSFRRALRYEKKGIIFNSVKLAQKEFYVVKDICFSGEVVNLPSSNQSHSTQPTFDKDL